MSFAVEPRRNNDHNFFRFSAFCFVI